MTEMGYSWGMTRLVMHNLHTYYALYWVHVITSGHSQGAAAEVDITREQYSWTNAIEEQQLKQAE